MPCLKIRQSYLLGLPLASSLLPFPYSILILSAAYFFLDKAMLVYLMSHPKEAWLGLLCESRVEIAVTILGCGGFATSSFLVCRLPAVAEQGIKRNESPALSAGQVERG